MRLRDRESECEFTRQLATGLGLDVHALNVYANRRADAYGDNLPEPGRNLELEAAEELADCRNYIVWRLQAIHRGECEDEDRTMHLQRALRHTALAFEEIRQALR